MNITLNATDRKPLVKAISELTGEKAVYMKTPTYAYKIGDYTITREGNLEAPDGLDAETLQRLKDTLESACRPSYRQALRSRKKLPRIPRKMKSPASAFPCLAAFSPTPTWKT